LDCATIEGMTASRIVFSRSVLVAWLTLEVSCTTIGTRIDGTSEQSFNKTHGELIESLSPENRMRLTFAEIIYLSKFDCARRNLQTSLVDCRRELDGKGFADILRLSKQVKGKVKVGFIVPSPSE